MGMNEGFNKSHKNYLMLGSSWTSVKLWQLDYRLTGKNLKKFSRVKNETQKKIEFCISEFVEQMVWFEIDD